MELIPFLRCRLIRSGKSPPGQNELIEFQLTETATAFALVDKDYIYSNRLCKVKIHEWKRNTAVILLPLPDNRLMEVQKILLEWHH